MWGRTTCWGGGVTTTASSTLGGMRFESQVAELPSFQGRDVGMVGTLPDLVGVSHATVGVLSGFALPVPNTSSLDP